MPGRCQVNRAAQLATCLPRPGAAGWEGAGEGEAAPSLSEPDGSSGAACWQLLSLWRGWFDVPDMQTATGSWASLKAAGLMQGTSGEVFASGRAEMLP